jgi:hypothetical protein
MPEFGYVIVRNPGPNTTLEFGGFTGKDAKTFRSPDDLLEEVKKVVNPGDQAHLLTMSDAEENGGCSTILVVDTLEDGDTTFRERG